VGMHKEDRQEMMKRLKRKTGQQPEHPRGKACLQTEINLNERKVDMLEAKLARHG